MKNIDLQITIEKHAYLSDYLPTFHYKTKNKVIDGKIHKSYISIDIHDDFNIYYALNISWPYSNFKLPNGIKDIIKFCYDSLKNKNKILYCIKCEKYEYLKPLAMVLMKCRSIKINNNTTKYIMIYDNLIGYIKIPIQPQKLKEWKLKLFHIMTDKKLSELNHKILNEKSDENLRHMKNEYEKWQKMFKDIFKNSFNYNTTEKINDKTSIINSKYENIDENTKNQIRNYHKYVMLQNKVSPKNIWQPEFNVDIKNKIENDDLCYLV